MFDFKNKNAIEFDPNKIFEPISQFLSGNGLDESFAEFEE